MGAAVVDFIEYNNTIDFAGIFVYFFLCVISFWLIVAFLTARDAYFKFGKWYWAIFWFLVVFFIFGIGIILYFLVRPDRFDEFDYDFDGGHMSQQGGLNIPIANFTGDKGEVLMSFQLSVKSAPLAKQVSDMKIDIDWESEDKNKELSVESLDKETKEVEVKLDRLTSIYNGFKAKLQELKVQEKERQQDQTQPETDEARSGADKKKSEDNKEKKNSDKYLPSPDKSPSPKVDKSTKVDESPKVDKSPNADKSTKVDKSPNADKSTKVDKSTKADEASKDVTSVDEIIKDTYEKDDTGPAGDTNDTDDTDDTDDDGDSGGEKGNDHKQENKSGNSGKKKNRSKKKKKKNKNKKKTKKNR